MRAQTNFFLAETALEPTSIVFYRGNIDLVAQRVIKPQIRSPPHAESMRPRGRARQGGCVIIIIVLINAETYFLEQRAGSIAQRALQRIRMQTGSAGWTLK